MESLDILKNWGLSPDLYQFPSLSCSRDENHKLLRLLIPSGYLLRKENSISHSSSCCYQGTNPFLLELQCSLLHMRKLNLSLEMKSCLMAWVCWETSQAESRVWLGQNSQLSFQTSFPLAAPYGYQEEEKN